ncbi:MAG: diacylglycerol kinase [Acidobacteriota bacterium]|jgi:diacylglycerol kinase family enzyme|nr:diacylglycerol kinase [Acidobacteriota bacterium]
MSGARLFVIINNAAARARAAWPRVREALAGEGVGFEAHESLRPGETEERTRAGLARGFETIAVVGGDGTLSAAAGGYFEPCEGLHEGEAPRAVNASAALALLPAGTGDDFARGLTGGRREPLEAWLARLVRHCRRDIDNVSDETDVSNATDVSDATNVSDESDVSFKSAAGFQRSATTRDQSETTRGVDVLLGSVDGGARRFVCLNAATLGIGAEVAGRVASQGPNLRRLPGEARFALAAVRSLAAWRNRRVRVSVDGRVWEECATNLIAIANGTYAGGGMNFSPEASLTDGLLDVLTVCRLSRAELIRELTRVHRGGHINNPKVKLTRGTHVRVDTVDDADSLGIEADGDPRGHTPADFRVLPAALRVVF